ncbi:hypothetical protein GE061_003085 [Apolygus lucorum]|uniref:Uncharacterized protein n=1 Tax=Apolygus lucorum TaxID=248454 RepID=A0A6A4JCX7_APOLU|nr:hypothetical protein GE061_003085 [Apolygus lucorum]
MSSSESDQEPSQKRKRGQLEVKTFINGLTSSTSIFKKTDRPPDFPTINAYPAGRVPINKKKIQDVAKLRDYVTGYAAFYDIILAWPTSDRENNQNSDYEEE